jgi:hypothetical protein
MFIQKVKTSLTTQVLHQQILVHRPSKPVYDWPNIFSNMLGRGWRVDVRIAHTVTFLLRCPWSSVPEAMRACKYTFDERASRSKQMAIRRSFAKATGGELVAPLDVIVAAATATMTTVSPLTNQTSAVRGPSTPPPTTTTTTRMPF